ncbi:MAG TPA: hypothetical protein VG796_04205 [Verrucomicrobiales bacterium]|jgi:hypothetical protein|nr:hypothetical protein [Verrucomicrobiales bacterium]
MLLIAARTAALPGAKITLGLLSLFMQSGTRQQLGDASSHSTKNLPVLLAGGGFDHGQHLHFDPQNPLPLCNLYVSMLQRLGIEADHFGTSNGTLSGLAMA